MMIIVATRSHVNLGTRRDRRKFVIEKRLNTPDSCMLCDHRNSTILVITALVALVALMLIIASFLLLFLLLS